MLVGLLAVTYVRDRTEPDPPVDIALVEEHRRPRRGGAGGLRTFFAVGCPGLQHARPAPTRHQWRDELLEPVQPVLSLAAVGLLPGRLPAA